jgi:PAS domain S-box-containing protein
LRPVRKGMSAAPWNRSPCRRDARNPAGPVEPDPRLESPPAFDGGWKPAQRDIGMDDVALGPIPPTPDETNGDPELESPGAFAAAILDALPAKVALLDLHGTILAANEAWRIFASETGAIDSGLVVGRNYFDETTMAPGDWLTELPNAADGIREVLSGRTPQYVAEYPSHLANGLRWFRMMVSPLRRGAIAGAMVMHIDITERKDSEERLFLLKRLYAVQGRINEAITRVRKPQALYEQACRIAVEDGGMIMAWVGEIDPETRLIRPVAKAGKEDGYLDRVQFSIDDFVHTPGPFGVAMREGRVDASNDIATDPRMELVREAALARGYHSAVAVPVKAGSTSVAAFMFYAETAGFFQEPEFRLMAAIGDDISFALESMRAEDERRKAEHSLRESEKRTAAFSELGRKLNSAATALAAGKIVVQVADELIGWDAATFNLSNEDGSRMVSQLNIDTIDGRKQPCATHYNYSPASVLARETIQNGGQLLLREPGGIDNVGGRRFGDVSRPSASLLFVPVRDGSRVIGVLSIQSYRFHAYDAGDLETLQALADYCGGAMSRIQAEAALQASQADMAAAQRIAQMGNWFQELPGDRLYWSDEVCKLHGVPENSTPTVEEALAFATPVSRNLLKELFEACAQEGNAFDERFQIDSADGRRLWVRAMGEAKRDGGGVIRRIQGAIQDVTAGQRAAEQAALIDEARDAFVVQDLDHRILFWSKGAERLYGWTATEVTGRRIQDLFGIDSAKFQEADDAVRRDGAWAGEFEKAGKSGDKFTVDARWTMLRDARQQGGSILTIDSDITEKKRTQAHFLRAQRMESIGTLAGGIAHDLNNVLAPILMSLELLKEKPTEEEKLELLATLKTSAQRGADLVRQVLTFARGIEGQRVSVNLSQLMREIQHIIRDTFPKSVELRLVPPESIWNVTGDPTQLHQVFLNLCVNARDAMSSGGQLTISMENTVLDEIYVGMNPGSTVGAYVCVKVADNGAGIPAEIRERIFEPFFTTKELGKGTGLGLSTSLAIVKSHGGFINLYSEAGRGTIFKIYLPANTTMTEAEAASDGRPQFPRGRGELILVVDDEEGIRKVAQKTLERFGYRVVTARHGAEALSIYARLHGEIGAVMTDMAMPIMDGPALIIALKTMDPDVKVIASSGLNSNGGVAKAIGAGVEHFIPKPYTAEVLLKTLAKLLGDKPCL